MVQKPQDTRFQLDTGTILITEKRAQEPTAREEIWAVYTRVSANENRPNLDSQADRLVAYCVAKGHKVHRVVKEVGSGVNDSRPKLLKLLADTSVTVIVVEHKDRLTRFGFKYIETLLATQGRRIEVVNLSENMIEDILADLTNIVYSFCARLYGQRRAKRKTEKIVQNLQAKADAAGDEQAAEDTPEAPQEPGSPRTVRRHTSPLSDSQRHGRAEVKVRIRAMQLTEQHILTRNDSRFEAIDAAAFAAKNLYNAANYLVRQSFIFQGEYLNYYDVHAQMKAHEAYQALPRKVSQQVLRMLDKNWQGFFAAMKAYRADPFKFRKKPGLPRYLDKTDGRYVLVYTIQALSKPSLKRGVIVPSGLAIEVRTHQTRIAQVRIVPKGQFYVVEVVYEQDIKPAAVDLALVVGIDVGLNNLAAITSNKIGFVPILVNGRPLKYINQGYNKRRAELQAKLGQPGRTKRMERLTTRRTRQIKHYLHTHSRRIIDLLVREGIGTLVIGKNDGWKQEISIGKRNNQNFVQVPHARFIQMLSYKAELVGIQVILTNESHTSKCSFLDDEPVQHHARYVGKRIKRGLFRAADGRQIINADVNGAYNIIRKAIPGAFGQGKAGVVVHPVGSAPTH